MEFLSQTYVALRGPTGAPQTALDTISRLSDRLSPSTLLADRRASVLSLKGLARDHKRDVGERAIPGLLEVLQNDAELDADIGKAVLDTLNHLCDTEEGSTEVKELGFKHTDRVLADEKATHKLFALLAADQTFYTRFGALQFLSTLLRNRRQIVQSYFLTAVAGPAGIIAVLEDRREIIRNEAITMLQSLISQSPEIQKVLTFEGAFERLFNIITTEGGIDGGIVVQDALLCVDGLLRFNASNQSYFRETPMAVVLLSLLQFPPNLPTHEPAPQQFALQFWDTQKGQNAGLVIGIIGMLVATKGANSGDLSPFTRCLLEMALASNAPSTLKTQSLRLLPINQSLPLSDILVTTYIPVPETNGEEWDRLEPTTALDALVELILNGEYSGLHSTRRDKEALELRATAAGVFESFVGQNDIRLLILQAMIPSEDGSAPPPVTPLLQFLATPPTSPLNPASVVSTQLAAILFAHLLRNSFRAKTLARSIKPPGAGFDAGQGSFFVPADGQAPAPPQPSEDEDDSPQTLIQLLNEHLSLALLSRSHASSSDREAREWDRLVTAYLTLLSQWLWEDSKAVREFLDAGGLGILVEPVNQTSESDVLVPGLCALLLGICYEFNREPGEVTRATIHPILNRLGIDALMGRITRLREDERLKAVSPESTVLPYPTSPHSQPGLKPETTGEAEVWFDWPFVDFLKSNYYTIQRGIRADPNSLSSSAGQTPETEILVASLKEMMRNQSQEIESLQSKLKTVLTEKEQERKALEVQISQLTSDIQAANEKRQDVEKEQEDLLVLLDELSSKRRRDKDRLREAGLEVSEDEGDEDEGEDE
ncbi:hypothetical protein NEOLEDRAFT_1131101 [Neolentinus lepideus HHB14362 ss-1]|uniref:Vesicle tethering protein Uso1/P115-like head domain-containing protein n=1 Tax=Neolentinus lepideus HHB14362 ss-1 TaxID=1314782 RepID=A0A165TSJ7_9AGAM|nr:hypothetical protein NEOLEDRAFT_1131101 [Neolentinus lepideus HHB14362 ss-1]